MSATRARPIRRVFGRIKNIPYDGHLMTFELRKDGLWFHRKHSSKWFKIEFLPLIDEQRRQALAAKALADARREDPRQMVMFKAVEV